MAIPNISSLLIERDRRNAFQFSGIRAQHGIPAYNNYIFLTNDTQTGIDVDGFIFGRDIWGVGVFSDRTSNIGAKYGL